MDQDDGAIVGRVLARDRDAFGILIDRHGEGATRFALRIVRGRADAEDVVQEAWLHAFLELAELRARDRFVAWLLGIVVRVPSATPRSPCDHLVRRSATSRFPLPGWPSIPLDLVVHTRHVRRTRGRYRQSPFLRERLEKESEMALYRSGPTPTRRRVGRRELRRSGFRARRRFDLLTVALTLTVAMWAAPSFSSLAGAAAKSKIVLAWHAGLASRWLDPQEHDGTATPDNFLTAIHDALIKNQGTEL